MKIKLIGGETLREPLSLLLPEIGAVLCDAAPDLTVTVKETCDDLLLVEKNGSEAALTYGGGKSRAFRGFAKLVSAAKDGTDLSCEEHPSFSVNGAMIDVSRGNVLTLDGVKFMLRKMALMGQNMYMLYTEDMLEIPARPYFGYMRGRYSIAEIKELDAYAQNIGIELIPCLELLSHMSAVLQWPATGAYKDTAWTLNVGSEETYKFIGDILDTIKDTFTTNKIHIGLDESDDLGLGAYLRNNAYAPKKELFFKHLSRLGPMLKERGFEPMMWSDMIFHFYGENIPNCRVYDPRVELPEDIEEKCEGIRPVFWSYGDLGGENYDKLFTEHKKMYGETMFAGGVWIWSGFAPNYTISKKCTISALSSAMRCGVKEVMATVWTNGSEGSIMLTAAGLAWFADMDYVGEYNEESAKKCFADATGGLNLDDFMLLEKLEHPTEDAFCATRALTYNDPMVPLADAHIPDSADLGAYYRDVSEKIRAIADAQKEFSPEFVRLLRLSELLEKKADFGIRLKAAYDAKDTAALEAFLDECDDIKARIHALAEAHKKAFFAFNKPFGWELHDIRYGGMMSRFVTVKERIALYLSGELCRLEELEAERLPFKPNMEEKFGDTFMWVRYRQIASPSLSLPI